MGKLTWGGDPNEIWWLQNFKMQQVEDLEEKVRLLEKRIEELENEKRNRQGSNTRDGI